MHAPHLSRVCTAPGLPDIQPAPGVDEEPALDCSLAVVNIAAAAAAAASPSPLAGMLVVSLGKGDLRLVQAQQDQQQKQKQQSCSNTVHPLQELGGTAGHGRPFSIEAAYVAPTGGYTGMFLCGLVGGIVPVLAWPIILYPWLPMRVRLLMQACLQHIQP